MRVLSYTILLGICVTVFGEKARFDNYHVYSIEANTEEQLKSLQELENHQDGLTFMIPPTSIQSPVDVIVPPHKFADFAELCEKNEWKNEMRIENLQK